MNVAIYLHPTRSNSNDREEDFLISSPELHGFLDQEQAGNDGVLIPVPELRPLIQSSTGEVADHLRDSLDHLAGAHMVLLVRRPLS